eukprot:TRINITY_DN23430_c0_g1_i1.p1 TRINITY_DN23430_c0_g1~~TRINITY_DN23430_c0_g1_i1.p1  ORF type:complete len:193 (+),score=61.45 TRINITY_DN23430_c0_g1_i1:53-631(+)
MSAYKDVLKANDGALKEFQDQVGDWVVACDSKAKVIDGKAKVDGADWEEFEALKGKVVRALDGVSMYILRKLPVKQHEDTLGAEVQEWVLECIGKYSKSLKGIGGSESPSTISSYTGYLSAVAGLHKDKKDRPEGYPEALDEIRLAATERQWAGSLANSYSTLSCMLVDVSTRLTRNKELLNNPKREFNTMM